jgi:catechol 2,3-dioxygenase-like lactoylglutathione lyase family enzyme
MAQLRHFAIVVSDQEKSAKFYEKAFGLKRVGFEDLGWSSAMYLRDDAEKENFERKFKDPDGIIIDISRKGWSGTAGKR